MALTNLGIKEQKEFELIPAGNHIGVCYLIADLGTQDRPPYQGQEKQPCHQLIIGWELTNTLMSTGEPFVISKRYNVFSAENSKFRKDIESWAGRGFADEEFRQINILNFLNTGCLINIRHEVSKGNGKTYTNVDSVTPLMQGMEKPGPFNPLVVYDLDEHSEETFNQLYPWIQEIVKQSPEYVIATEGWEALKQEAIEKLRKAGHVIPE